MPVAVVFGGALHGKVIVADERKESRIDIGGIWLNSKCVCLAAIGEIAASKQVV